MLESLLTDVVNITKIDCFGLVCDDVCAVPKDSNSLEIHGKTENLERLGDLCSLEFLTLSDADEEILHQVCTLTAPKWAVLWNLRAEDISALRNWSGIERLIIDGIPRVSDISPLGSLKNLELLYIVRAPKARDIAALSSLSNLKYLCFAGGYSTSSKRVPTLRPLTALKQLQYISLGGVNSSDRSLAPLAEIHALKEIDLSNNWPTEEFARLSVLFPDAGCEWFVPFVEEKFSAFTATEQIPQTMVFVTGSRKPYFKNPTDDDWATINAYAKKFREYQAAFRKQYGLPE